jgi:hypothetical protein
MFHLFRASYVYKCIHIEISCRLGLNLAKSAQKPRLGNFPQWKLSRAKFPETFRNVSGKFPESFRKFSSLAGRRPTQTILVAEQGRNDEVTDMRPAVSVRSTKSN